VSKRDLGVGAVAGGTIAAIVFGVAGCGSFNEQNATSGDLKGVTADRPQKIRAFNNIDRHPNIVELCIDGRAFLTTSRLAGVNLMRFPDDDQQFCGATTPSRYYPQAPLTGDRPQPEPTASSTG
jgi:hypothetical protein